MNGEHEMLEPQVIALRRQGQSARSIALLLGPSPASVDRILARAVERGETFPQLVMCCDGRTYQIPTGRAPTPPPVAGPEPVDTMRMDLVRASGSGSITPTVDPKQAQAMVDALQALGYRLTKTPPTVAVT